MSTTLNRGQRVPLAQVLEPGRPFEVGVAVGSPGLSVDVVSFGLSEEGRLEDERYMTYFNQPATPCRGISLAAPGGDRDGFAVDLSRLPESVRRVVVVAAVDGAGVMADVVGSHVRLLQGGQEVARFGIPGELFEAERAAMLVELYCRNGEWRLSAVAQGFEGGLDAVVRHFGGVVAEAGASAPASPSAPPLPPISLLAAEEPPPPARPEDEPEAVSAAIEATLRSFRVGVRVARFEVGPVVTTFDLEPAPGVKVSKIEGHQDELAIALTTPGVRIAPEPSRGVVIVEVPRRHRIVLPLRRIVESPEYHAMASALALPMGLDPSGATIVSDLQSFPHLLVSGATGSGKSVALNAMLCAILLRATHYEVRLILVDPKQLELSVYNGVPHLLAPVITDMSQCGRALEWAIDEMMSRYKRMAALGVRNLESYRSRVAECRRSGESPTWPDTSPQAGQPVPLDPLPFLVIMVDELADLMLQMGADVETKLVRLAQMGRAAGVHLILATQRPSADVVTGLIKANFPTRLSFRVASKVDSRVVLDTNGAETLQGQGDGLLLAPGRAHLRRLLAPFVSEAEVQSIVRFLRTTTGPRLDPTLMERFDVQEMEATEIPVGGSESRATSARRRS